MSVHFHSSCKPNAAIKFSTEVYISQHGHSRNFSNNVVVVVVVAIWQSFIIHLTYKIYNSAMLYSKESNSW
jgi:hypothetical protein